MTTNATINLIINIGLALLLLVVVCVAFYFYILGKVYKEGADAINDAEQDDKEGKEKLDLAVSRIYDAIPAVLRPLFTRTVVTGIVQMLFDKIEAYARKQAKKYAGKKADDPPAASASEDNKDKIEK